MKNRVNIPFSTKAVWMSTRAQCEQVNVNWPKRIDLQRIPQINMASSLVCNKQKAREEHVSPPYRIPAPLNAHRYSFVMTSSNKTKRNAVDLPGDRVVIKRPRG